MKIKLLYKLLAILAFSATLPLIAAGYHALNVFERWAGEETRLELEEQRAVFDALLDFRMTGMLENISAFARDSRTVRALTAADRNRLLTLAISEAEALAAEVFFVVSNDETLVVDPVGMSRGDVDPRYDFHLGIALSRQFSVALEYDPDLGLGLAASAPIYDAGGRLIGAVVAFSPINPEWLGRLRKITGFDFTFATTDQRTIASTWLTDGQRLPLVRHVHETDPPATVVVESATYFADQHSLSDLTGTVIAHLVITKSDQSLRDTIAGVNLGVGGIAFVALAFALVAGGLFSRGITNALTSIVEATRRIAEGRFDIDIEVRSRDEIGELADAFEDMAGKLEWNIREREHAQGELLGKEEALRERVADLEEAQRKLEMQGESLVRLADDLLVARDEARGADRAKSEFLASMSHELRTPLNAVIGFSEIIKDETFGPVGSVQYRDYAHDIHESGQHLLGLINDILDLSKIESGNDELHEDKIEIPEIVHSAVKLLGQRVELGRVTLGLDLQDPLPALRADERKLKQILVNLLSNGVKFTPAGGKVTLRAWCRADIGYMFQITDTGIGIAAEDIPKALSRFGQVDAALNRQYEGTGLGLPLTMALVEQHGGSLDLQSEVSVGTTITVRFPAERIVGWRHDTEPVGVAGEKAS